MRRFNFVCGSLRYLVRIENCSNLNVISRDTKCVGTIHDIDTIVTWLQNAGNKLRGTCNTFCHWLQNALQWITHLVTG